MNVSLKKYAAEFLGAMVLVFMGCMAAVLLGTDVSGGLLLVALAFGLSVVAMAYAIGNISGCHINPAVSLAALLDKRISLVDFFGYIVSQVAGAIAGAGLLSLLIGQIGRDAGYLGSNLVAGAGGAGGAFIVEAVLTFIFVLVILNVTADKAKSNIAGLIIGLTLVLVIIVGISLTGVSVNPARSIGPAIFAGGAALTDLWVFIAAPFAGSIVAVVVYRLLKNKNA